MITPYNVLRHELVGLQAKVRKATHAGYEKITGVIAGETRNTITLRQNGVEKTLPKDSVTFELTLDDGAKVSVDGRLLAARPEDRVKKKVRIKFV